MTHFSVPTNSLFVSVEKIEASKDPISPPARWENWIFGSFINQGSLPISYALTGYLLAPIRYGHPIEVFRIERNGVEALGIFRSTPVVDIREHGVIETYNSIYRVSFEAGSATEDQ